MRWRKRHPLHLHTHHGRRARIPVIIDSESTTARGCPRHAVAALNGLTVAHVNWADSKGLNEWEHRAHELAEG
jgi:hypothetical protein